MGGTDGKSDEKVEETSENQSQKSDEDVKLDNYRSGEWMIKPCDFYKSEYKDCRSFKGRFYQYFYNGENELCQQWKVDYENCRKWKKEDNDEAYNKLLASEKQRREKRLRAHIQNDVWKKREKPPGDWSEPLPDWMQKRDENTFFAVKQKEIEKGVDTVADLYIPNCCIM